MCVIWQDSRSRKPLIPEVPELPQGLAKQCEDSVKELEKQVLGSDPELLEARELMTIIPKFRCIHG